MIRKLLILLIILAGCTKEATDRRMVELLVECSSTYVVTYGTSDQVTVKAEDKWGTTFWANHEDTILLNVKTSESPATLYLRLEMEEGLLYCKSLYIEPQSTGTLNCVVDH